MKVINFFGGPGAGKSTCAAELFAYMKRQHQNVELVTEYAKDLVYEGTLGNMTQEMIFANQHWRLERLKGHVDYVITDSPIILSAVYKQDSPAWDEYVTEVFYSYDNFNIFINRPDTYHEVGRIQTLEQAREIDNIIKDEPIDFDMVVDKEQFNPVRVCGVMYHESA